MNVSVTVHKSQDNTYRCNVHIDLYIHVIIHIDAITHIDAIIYI